MPRKPRVLCICHGGNVRSASVAYHLKELGVDAVPVGVWRNEPDTIALLFNWADRVWLAEPDLVSAWPPPKQLKVFQGLHVGPDIWGNPFHPELIPKAVEIANHIKLLLPEYE